jgi:hypothetical protein
VFGPDFDDTYRRRRIMSKEADSAGNVLEAAILWHRALLGHVLRK